MDSMKEAMKRRRQGGVQVIIMGGQPQAPDAAMQESKEQMEDKSSDLAPAHKADVKAMNSEEQNDATMSELNKVDPEHPDKAQDIELMEEVLGKDLDLDKEIGESQSHRARSLGERAKMEAFQRMKAARK